MRTLIGIVMALAISLMVSVPTATAAYPEKGEVVMKQGDTVHLFHSGTADVKKEICLNDVVPVYREKTSGGHTESNRVGMVKILSYEGEHYFKGQIVDGNVKPGDIVKKKTAACMVSGM